MKWRLGRAGAEGALVSTPGISHRKKIFLQATFLSCTKSFSRSEIFLRKMQNWNWKSPNLGDNYGGKIDVNNFFQHEEEDFIAPPPAPHPA